MVLRICVGLVSLGEQGRARSASSQDTGDLMCFEAEERSEVS